MADIGTIVAKLGLDPSQLLAGVNAAKGSLSSVSQAMGSVEQQAANLFSASNIRGFAEDVGKLNNPLQSVGGRLQAIGELGSAFSQLSAPIQQFSAEMQEAAGRADDLRDGLNGAFRDQAPAVADLIESIGTAQGVLNDGQLAAAAKTLQNLGTFSEAALRRVADAAVSTGKPVESLAEAFGRFEKFGDSKSILGLQKAIGASGEELRALGATLDTNDKLLVDTEARTEAARVALERFGATKFGGALAAVSDDSAKLAGELELLKREIGASTFAMREQLDSALLPLVQGFRQAGPEIKGFVGLTAGLVSGVGQAIVPAVTLAAQLKILGFSSATVSAAIIGLRGAFSSAATAMVGMSAGIGGLIVILGSAAAGLALYTRQLEDTTKAEEDYLAAQERNAKALRENKDLVGKSAADLQKMGKTSKDLVPILQGLQDQLQQARDVDPNSAATKGLQEKIREFRKTKSELEKAELATREAPVTPGAVGVSVGEQAKIDERARKERKAADEKERKERKDREEAHRKELLDIALDEIKRKAAAHEIDKNAEIAALQEVLKAYVITASEKRNIQQQIATLTGQILDKEASDTKARNDKLRQQQQADAETLRKVKKAGFDKQIKDAQDALKKLDEEERRGADVSIRRQAELAKKTAAEKAKIDLQADTDRMKTTDGNVKANITKQAKGDKQTVDREAADEADRISKERKEADAQDRQDELNFDLEIQGKKVAALRQLADAGAISSQQIKTALEQQLALQLQLIEAQREQALMATSDPTKIAQANKRAEIAILEAKSATRKEIEATTAALKKQQEQQSSKSPLNLGGGQQSLEEFFASQQGFFDITKSPTATGAKDLQSIAEQQRILQSLDKGISPTIAQQAKSTIPFASASKLGQSQTAAAGPQSIQSTVNNNTVNGTSIDDPALAKKIGEIVNQIVKTDNFRRGNG